MRLKYMIEATFPDEMRVSVEENEGNGIPFYLVDKLLAYLPYASKESVAIKLLFYTGCRISEIEHMKTSNIYENHLYWQCGKNQTGQTRKEYLPDYFLKEIEACHKRHRMRSEHIVSLKGKTISRYFNDHIRSLLGSEWLEKRQLLHNNTIKLQYRYQLKGFRKNFATLFFMHYWKKYKDAGVAVEMTSKRMRHSCREITAHHYIETADQINAEDFAELLPFQIIKNMRQKRMYDYF